MHSRGNMLLFLQLGATDQYLLQIPGELNRKLHWCWAGSKREKRKFKRSLPSIIMGKDQIPDSNFSLSCFPAIWTERHLKRSGNSKWGGLDVIVNNWWFHPEHVSVKHCPHCPNIDLLACFDSPETVIHQQCPLKICCKIDRHCRSILATASHNDYLKILGRCGAAIFNLPFAWSIFLLSWSESIYLNVYYIKMIYFKPLYIVNLKAFSHV